MVEMLWVQVFLSRTADIRNIHRDDELWLGAPLSGDAA
jgi:hypothetical protein